MKKEEGIRKSSILSLEGHFERSLTLNVNGYQQSPYTLEVLDCRTDFRVLRKPPPPRHTPKASKNGVKMVKTGIAFVLPAAAFLAGALILTSQWSISDVIDVYRISTGVSTDTACNSGSTSIDGETRSKQFGNKNPSKYLLPLRPKKFVVLSATIGVNARPEPYAYLCALTARNWNNFWVSAYHRPRRF